MRVVIVLTLCALEAVLICILLIERRKRLQKQTEIMRNTIEQQQGELQRSRLFIERIAETTPSAVFVYDLVERRNVYVNERSSLVLGYSAQEMIDMGDQFLTRLMHPDDLALLPQLNQLYQSRPAGAVFENVFRLKHKNGQWRSVHRLATVFLTSPDGKPRQLIGTATDITDLKRTREELQQLSSRLLNVLDVERERIARELHDTTAQNLFVMSMNLTSIKGSAALPEKVRAALEECQALCDEALKEVRTLSYVLHPPMLDRGGLVTTLRSYLGGLTKRSGIEVQLETSETGTRLPRDVETELFRITQEALANVIRHSHSKRAVVRFEIKNHQAVLEIVDFGRGMRNGSTPESIDGEVTLGVGINNMRERVRSKGGTLEILSGNQGTTVKAIIPADLNDPGQ